MYSRILICLLTLISLIACSASSDEDKLRTWTDVQGRTMQAKLIGVNLDANEVVFLKDTGRRYRFPISQMSKADQRYIYSRKDMLPDLSESSEPVIEQRTDFEKAISKDLVQFYHGRMKQIQETDLSTKDYYLVYYSAHWCPPCRKFTPQLISFYNSYSKKHENFEIIFVSSDRSKDAMENYIKNTNMPWPALEFDKTQTSHPATKYKGSGIPCLVLLDNKGSVLAHSYSGSRYVGPTSVMNALKERLNHP